MKTTSQKLKLIRNIILIAGTLLSFLLWLRIPDYIKNSSLIHVGYGEYGSKWGCLLGLLIPLFALIPQKPGDEIHTNDAEEQERVREEWEIHSRKMQVFYAALLSIVTAGVMLMTILFG